VTERVRRIAMIARWKPVHRGHEAVLQGLLDHAAHALVGIGSSNRYDARNPFTARETEDMIRIVLEGRSGTSLIRVPDLDHGPRWRAMVREIFSPVDLFVTENEWVRTLLRDDFPIVHPVELVPAERRVRVDGTMVRRAMARGDDWRPLVPEKVASYLERQGLVERLRREFGAVTLADERARA
jgi:nicotinamide-nucleotide adenylyltransferase